MTNEGKPEVAAAGEPAPTKEPPETGALLRRFAAEAAHMLDWLAQFGSGANADEGVTRLLYTPAWQQAQGALAERLAGCGLAVSYDDVGNLYARLDGAREREVVATARTSIRSSAEDVTTARTALWRAPSRSLI